jgi:hypothetical protein
MRNRMPNLLTALAALGCGGTPGAGGAPGSCDFRAPAAAVRVTVTGAPATFETLAGEAMNTLDLEARGPLPPARQNALARGPCGTVGLAYRRTVGTAAELAYLELGNDSGGTPGTAQTVASGSPGLAFSLFFEPDCTPVIAHPNGNGMVQHRREGGRWTSAATSLDLRSAARRPATAASTSTARPAAGWCTAPERPLPAAPGRSRSCTGRKGPRSTPSAPTATAPSTPSTATRSSRATHRAT